MPRFGRQSVAILGTLLMLSCLFVPLASASGQIDVDGDGIVDGLTTVQIHLEIVLSIDKGVRL